MRAAVITEPGGPDVLKVLEVDDPVPGPEDVLVDVKASALNRADMLQREGGYPAPPGNPSDIPGLEFAGVVIEAGERVIGMAKGDRVFGLLGGGGYASRAGDIMDRTAEHLGRTDLPIVFMRRQFEQQMLIVEDGGDPKNVFRDSGSMPDRIHGGIWDENDSSVTGAGGAIVNFRSAYHKGYGVDDADRYGPAMPMIIDLMQRIDDHNAALASD